MPHSGPTTRRPVSVAICRAQCSPCSPPSLSPTGCGDEANHSHPRRTCGEDLGRRGGEGGGLGELNGNSILSGRETREEDWRTEDDDGEIGPRLFRLPVSCLSLHSGGGSLSLKISVTWGFVIFQFPLCLDA